VRKYLSFFLLCCFILSVSAGCTVSHYSIDYSDVDINIDTSENAIEDLTLCVTKGSEISNNNPLQSSTLENAYVLINLYDTLTGVNSDGQIVPMLAESWETNEDGTIWTFRLRDDVYWVDVYGNKQEKVIAEDFITSLEYLMNYHKNINSNSNFIAVDFVAGAQDYYNLTKEMTEEEAWNLDYDLFLETVGIEAPDEHTVIYRCAYSCPYFDSVAINSTFCPISRKLIEKIGIEQFQISPNKSVWYCGPYLFTSFINGNEMVLEANPWWYGNDENTRFKSVTIKILESNAIGYQLYKNGEIDQVRLTQALVQSISSDENNKFNGSVSYDRYQSTNAQMSFNFNKRDKDGNPDENWNKAAANEAFRKSFYYGVDFTQYLMTLNSIDPMYCANKTICPSGLVKFSDGTDYADYVKEKMGLTEHRINKESAEQYKKQAIEELTAIGVTFPVEIDYYVSGSSQASIDTAKLIRDIFENCLGTDYVKINIKTYVSSFYSEVRVPGIASILATAWGADFGDPISFHSCYVYGWSSSSYSNTSTHINDFSKMAEEEIPEYEKELLAEYTEYTRLVDYANSITEDTDERYRAFAEAECYAIEHVLTGVPYYRDVICELTKVDNSSITQMAYGVFDHRYVNWKTNKNGYSD